MSIPMLVGLLHVALVAPHYYVGSFDDDSSYILSARALLAGHGLSAVLPSGVSVASLYPPGYPALLVPLAWVWPHSFLPLRLLSVGCYAALFPLMWVYLGRYHTRFQLRVAVLGLLALCPVLATFASMVMAEAPFLVLFLGVLLLLDRWDAQARAWTPAGLGVVVGAAGLVWLKQAAVGLVAGMVLWLVLRRARQWWGRALMVVVGVGGLLLPMILIRVSDHIPIAGSRYSSELGGYYQGGLGRRLVDVLPHSTWHLLATAIPATLVPYLEPLPLSRYWADFWIGLSWQVTILVAAGAVVWFRRHRDAAVVVVAAYLAETVLWPEVNERRAILVVPLLAAWYVFGAASVWELIRARSDQAAAPVSSAKGRRPLVSRSPAASTYRGQWAGEGAAPALIGRSWHQHRVRPQDSSAAAPAGSGWPGRKRPAPQRAERARTGGKDPGPDRTRLARAAAGIFVAGAVLGPLVAQMPRDYLFGWGQNSSHFEGSRYVAMLSNLGRPADVVETDYMSTTALFTGHRTNYNAFVAALFLCYPPVITHALAADDAGFLLVGDLNKPGLIDSPCLLTGAQHSAWAVPLLHTRRDDASVFELIGPGTGHPTLSNLLTGTSPTVVGGTVEYDWPSPRLVMQASVGEAALVAAGTTSVRLEVRQPQGPWVVVAQAGSAVGDSGAPFLLAHFPSGVTATGLRVVVTGPPGRDLSIADVAAVGRSAPTTS